MAEFSIKRVIALPAQLEASTMYITRDPNNANLVGLTFVGTNVSEVRHIPNLADTQAAIDAAVNSLTVAQIPDLPGSKITSAVAEAVHAQTADSADSAAQADKLSTARSINGVAFDGTENITVPAVDTATPRVAVADIGVTVPSLVGGKIPVSQLPNGLDNIDTYPTRDDFPTEGQADTIYIADDTNTMYRWATNGSGYVIIPSGASTAEVALRLQTARVIALDGDATGQASFDGSEDVTITVTLDDVITAGEQQPVVTVDAKGRVLSSRALAPTEIPSLPGSKITSAVASADKLSTARTISVSGPLTGSVSFDGSGDVELELTGNGVTGTGAKVTTEGGLVTGFEALAVSDIPDLPGSKITSAVAEAVHAQTADALTVDAEW